MPTSSSFDPNGKGRRIYASGIRNCVGMALNPTTGDLWCSTNERDGLGDDLPPDYITRVREGAFYGWPWYYIGANEDPRHRGARPDLKDKVVVPDILIQPHSALAADDVLFGDQFPSEYARECLRGRARFLESRQAHRIQDHSRHREGRHADRRIRGFRHRLCDRRCASVWGRPVGIAQAKDGSLLFSEDGNGTIWRVTSAPSSFELRVQPFELNAGVRGCELPIGFGVMDVAILLPCGDFAGQGLFVGDAAIQTLG